MLTTQQRIEHAMTIADLGERIESVMHEIMVQKLNIEKYPEVYTLVKEKIDRRLRISQTHLNRLEQRFDNILIHDK